MAILRIPIKITPDKLQQALDAKFKLYVKLNTSVFPVYNYTKRENIRVWSEEGILITYAEIELRD